MIKFRVIHGPIVLPVGALLRVSDNLAAEHSNALIRRDDGAFMASKPTRWKTGDTLATDAKLPPIFRYLVEFDANGNDTN